MALRFTASGRAGRVCLIPPAVAGFLNAYSLDFDGADDGLTISGSQSSGDYDFIHNSKVFTINIWVKLDDYTASTSMVLMGNNYTGTYKGFQLWIDTRDTGAGQDHALRFNLWDGGAGVNLYEEGLIDDNDWHMYSVTSDNSTVKLFVDGVVQPTTASYSGVTAHASNFDLNIGERAGGGASFYAGLLDESLICNTTLTAANLLAHYNDGVPADPVGFSPVSHWRMGDSDGGTGSTVTDIGSLENDATIDGAIFTSTVPS